jgi:hypothetical protein
VTEAARIGGAAVVNGVLNGAITGVKNGGDYSRLKRGGDHWALSMVRKEGGAAARARRCMKVVALSWHG